MTVLTSLPYYKIATLVIDFVLIYLLTYRILSWLKRSHALNLIKGLFIFFLVSLVSSILDLITLNWIIEKFSTVLLILVFIIFQPELRRFLERIGSTGKLFTTSSIGPDIDSTPIVQKIIRSVDYLSKEKVGALIVLEKGTPLEKYRDTGITINSELSPEVLSTLFWPGTPTHDGAVMIKDSVILSAGCFLPLTNAPVTDRRLGTRHRAALGITEVSDAIVIVISEETGVISLAEDGNITRYLTKEALESHLFSVYSKSETKDNSWTFPKWNWNPLSKKL